MTKTERNISLILAVSSIALLALGCGKKEDEPQSYPPETLLRESRKVTPAEAIPFPSDWVVPVSVDYNDRNAPITPLEESKIRALDAEVKSYGMGTKTVEYNRAIWADASQKLFGKYSADFYRETEDKRIYLTFDEGYENGYTEKILDTLKEKNVKAVFFITMPYAETETDLVNRMIKEGHTVGNHSVNHPSKGVPSLSIEKQKSEVMDLHNYVLDKYKYEMYLFRYPEGIYSEQSMALIQSLGYRTVFWTFAHNDWNPDNQPDKAETLNALKEKLCPGEIILLHAISETNTEILGDFIDAARAEGYEFAAAYPR